MWDNAQLAWTPGNRGYAIFFLIVLTALLWAFAVGLWNGRMWGVASWFRHAHPVGYWSGQTGCGITLLIWVLLIYLLLNLPSCF